MTAPLCGSLQTHPGTQMPSGGGHIIRAESGRSLHPAPMSLKRTKLTLSTDGITPQSISHLKARRSSVAPPH